LLENEIKLFKQPNKEQICRTRNKEYDQVREEFIIVKMGAGWQVENCTFHVQAGSDSELTDVKSYYLLMMSTTTLQFHCISFYYPQHSCSL